MKMSKKKIVQAGKQVQGILNKVEFKTQTKKIKNRLKEKINNLKSNRDTNLVETKSKSKPKKIIRKIKKIKENINAKENLNKVKRTKRKIKEQLTKKIKSENTESETLAFVTPRINTKNKKKQLQKKSKQLLEKTKKLQASLAIKERIDKVKKIKNKKVTQHLIENTQQASLTTPIKNKQKIKIKKLQGNITIKEKIDKIKKYKKKKDTKHLLENAEQAGLTKPMKTKEKINKNNDDISPKNLQKRKKQLKQLQEYVVNKQQKKPTPTLRQKMMEKLEAARFRYLNEQIYTVDGSEAEKLFKTDPTAFEAYHKGFRQQVNRWPMNPLDRIIKMIKKMDASYVIADFGCGEAELAQSVPQKVHSFDLVAANDRVTACNMAHVPLENESVDVAVFCLSLMGTNLKDYLMEANRVIKVGGCLKVVEVESRFENVEEFAKILKKYYGFAKCWEDLSHNLFYFLDFKKVSNIKNRKKLPGMSLKPCIYKKR